MARAEDNLSRARGWIAALFPYRRRGYACSLAASLFGGYICKFAHSACKVLGGPAPAGPLPLENAGWQPARRHKQGLSTLLRGGMG